MVQICVEFPRTVDGMKSENYTVGRVPCIGECISTDGDDAFEVRNVIHLCDQTAVVAIVRVR